MNGIKPIQANNVFRVNPINLFESRGGSNAQLNGGLFARQSNSEFNLNHPKVAGSEINAKFLDLLA